jgi:diguanylate cyclase (GGDEF)-like protein
VIVLTLLIAMLIVSVSIVKTTEQKNHQTGIRFVHNIATQFIDLQLRPLENALNETGTLIDKESLSKFVDPNEKHPPLRMTLMHTLTLMPSIKSILIADEQGRFNSAPYLMVGNEYNAKTRPWFLSFATRALFINYTKHYASTIDQKETISISRPIVDKEGFFLGTLAMDVDLEQMSYPLRQLMSPLKGSFCMVDRDGDILLHSDIGNLFHQYLDPKLIEQMTNGSGHVFDKKHQTHIYYYSFSNPDWFVIYTVSDTDFKDASHSEFYLLFSTVMGCLLICLLCWWSLRHAINKMIVEIIAMMRLGRIDMSNPGERLRREIQEEHAQLKDAVTASTTDGLTTLFNRRSFDQDLHNFLTENRPFSVGLIDLDNFKSINDTHGHLVGDAVLRAVAQEGKSIAGQEATLYRYGGEELAIIIPGDDSARAQTLLEQWRTQVARRQWREPELVVTFSAGLALWRQESAEQLLARVDQALYQAKDAGKNQVHHAD